jgi:DNA polymerase
MMIVGEAPGKDEDSTRNPFTGPAGELMDKIWAAAGLDTNDFYITNVVLCRPVAPQGSGKENYTPKVEQRARCKTFLDAQIGLLKPSLIVTLGKVATEAILGHRIERMGDYRGRFLNVTMASQDLEDGTVTIGRPCIFPMIHPAAILHAQRDQEKYRLYRQQTWRDIQLLAEFIRERHLNGPNR